MDFNPADSPWCEKATFPPFLIDFDIKADPQLHRKADYTKSIAATGVNSIIFDFLSSLTFDLIWKQQTARFFRFYSRKFK